MDAILDAILDAIRGCDSGCDPWMPQWMRSWTRSWVRSQVAPQKGAAGLPPHLFIWRERPQRPQPRSEAPAEAKKHRTTGSGRRPIFCARASAVAAGDLLSSSKCSARIYRSTILSGTRQQPLGCCAGALPEHEHRARGAGVVGGRHHRVQAAPDRAQLRVRHGVRVAGQRQQQVRRLWAGGVRGSAAACSVEQPRRATPPAAPPLTLAAHSALSRGRI